MKTLALATAAIGLISNIAFAQYPTTMSPMGGGGYMITTPGQYPTMAMPMGNGGYMVTTPGQYPTTIMPLNPYGR